VLWKVLSEKARIDEDNDRLVLCFVCFTGLGEVCILQFDDLEMSG